LLGIPVGVLFAVWDVAALMINGHMAAFKSLALPIVVIYACLGGVIGIVLGLLASALRPAVGGVVEGVRGASLCLAVLVALFLGMEATYLIYKTHSIFVPLRSGAHLALLVAACCVTAVLFYLVFSRGLGALAARGRLRFRGLPLTAIVLCAGVLVAALLVTRTPVKYERGGGAAKGAGGRPDVFILLVDAMRPDHMSLYGYHRETTPSIDKLAEEGAVFLDAHAQSSWTRPTVATLFTSLYPSVHGSEGVDDMLPSGVVTMPESFRSAGYSTAIFSSNFMISPQFGYGEGVDVFVGPHYSIIARFSAGGFFLERLVKRAGGALMDFWGLVAMAELALRGETHEEGGHTAEELNSRVVDWAGSCGERPVFAYVHYMEPHTPYEPPPPFDKRFASPDKGEIQAASPPAVSPAPPPFGKAESVDDETRGAFIAAYDGEIACADAYIAELIDDLLSLRGENAIVIVTSDHGEEFYDHDGWRHGVSLYEEMLWVPLVFWSPDRIPGGRRIPGIVRQIDLLPTLLDLCDIPPVDMMLGDSFAGVLSGEEELTPGRLSLSELRKQRGYDVRAIQDERYKLVVARKGQRERFMLFDLDIDPLEKRDISEEKPQKVSEMFSAMEEIIAGAKIAGVRSDAPVAIDEETRDMLRSLGYVD
jgi:arylsulfatase A-like enzyme